MVNRTRLALGLIIMAALLGLLSLSVSGCSDSPTGPAKISINGRWEGVAHRGFTITATITEDDGSITGDGFINKPGISIAATITGTRAKTDVAWTFWVEKYQPMVFTGRIEDRNTISGFIDGSGFEYEPITFTR